MTVIACHVYILFVVKHVYDPISYIRVKTLILTVRICNVHIDWCGQLSTLYKVISVSKKIHYKLDNRQQNVKQHIKNICSLIFNMDGSLLGRYENKINQWEQQIQDDPTNAAIYENEMYEYMAACVPYIKQLSDDTSDRHTLNSVFASNVKKGIPRKAIYHDYLRVVENYQGVLENELVQYVDIDTCLHCKSSNVFLVQVNSDYVCGECGSSVLVMGDELSYKEEQEKVKVVNYSYKRDNHFNEWLLQFQARERTEIPSDVITQLRCEFKKQKLTNILDITHAKVRALLKKLRLNKYYEHVPYITNSLNGVHPPVMSQALEDRLRMMFRDIQEPFNKHCPETRKNFLSYSYVLYKFCELLGEDEFLACFPLLKSKEKLYQQDVIWKNICEELQWEFISTI
jgi:DNA-directed RNA polymerase subunit RPC12/RpoP